MKVVIDRKYVKRWVFLWKNILIEWAEVALINSSALKFKAASNISTIDSKMGESTFPPSIDQICGHWKIELIREGRLTYELWENLWWSERLAELPCCRAFQLEREWWETGGRLAPRSLKRKRNKLALVSKEELCYGKETPKHCEDLRQGFLPISCWRRGHSLWLSVLSMTAGRDRQSLPGFVGLCRL